MKGPVKGGIAGTVVLVIVVTIAFMVSGADFLEAGPEGVKIGNNPEPESTSIDIRSTGDNSVNIVGDGNTVTQNSAQIEELDKKINLLLDNAGISSQSNPAQNIVIQSGLETELEQLTNERDQLQKQLDLHVFIICDLHFLSEFRCRVIAWICQEKFHLITQRYSEFPSSVA